jgi:hypothetical protein
LLAVQLADHEKFVPPMRLQDRKACTRDDQGIDGVKIPLQVIELGRIVVFILRRHGFFCLATFKKLARTIPRSYLGRYLRKF